MNYNYAQLGTSCRSNMDVLVSNRKYLPQNYNRYDWGYTKMYRYPGENRDFLTTVGLSRRPEDIKTNQNDIPQSESYVATPPKKATPRCCGR